MENIINDTLSILLSNRINQHLPNKERALKISRCCKIVRDRTKDNALYEACRSVIKEVSKGGYDKAIEAVELTELNYWLGRK